MKKVVLILLAIVLLFFQAELADSQLSNPSQNKSKSTADTSQQDSAQKSSDSLKKDAKADSTQKPEVTVTAYYFHNTHRCKTCLTIERNAKDAIQRNFSKEIASGRLKFLPLNMEEKENQHFIKEYQLYSSSLILVKFRNGKQEKWENLQQVWFLIKDMEKFYQYVRDGVSQFLSESK